MELPNAVCVQCLSVCYRIQILNNNNVSSSYLVFLPHNNINKISPTQVIYPARCTNII